MRSLRYLNVVLTLIAVLLTLHLWTLWTAPAAGLPGSDNTTFSLAEPAYAQGIPNAGAQRKEMVGLLKSLNTKLDEQTALFRSGQARVQVTDGAKAEEEDQD